MTDSLGYSRSGLPVHSTSIGVANCVCKRSWLPHAIASAILPIETGFGATPGREFLVAGVIQPAERLKGTRHET